ncbi:uncharacterized protein LOC113146527 [Cyclospora cayetanensis]|uniref:Uncharacterized protein LOC113146527 n=1 Tax=Cyclospora cayetanensis TaxID=88456 RepID=A0A6P6RQ69_9EIME|nr:uncharacterized protein LOC113146527 [Cyclospora cayetanensis]
MRKWEVSSLGVESIMYIAMLHGSKSARAADGGSHSAACASLAASVTVAAASSATSPHDCGAITLTCSTPTPARRRDRQQKALGYAAAEQTYQPLLQLQVPSLSGSCRYSFSTSTAAACHRQPSPWLLLAIQLLPPTASSILAAAAALPRTRLLGVQEAAAATVPPTSDRSTVNRTDSDWLKLLQQQQQALRCRMLTEQQRQTRWRARDNNWQASHSRLCCWCCLRIDCLLQQVALGQFWRSAYQNAFFYPPLRVPIFSACLLLLLLLLQLQQLRLAGNLADPDAYNDAAAAAAAASASSSSSSSSHGDKATRERRGNTSSSSSSSEPTAVATACSSKTAAAAAALAAENAEALLRFRSHFSAAPEDVLLDFGDVDRISNGKKPYPLSLLGALLLPSLLPAEGPPLGTGLKHAAFGAACVFSELQYGAFAAAALAAAAAAASTATALLLQRLCHGEHAETPVVGTGGGAFIALAAAAALSREKNFAAAQSRLKDSWLRAQYSFHYAFSARGCCAWLLVQESAKALEGEAGIDLCDWAVLGDALVMLLVAAAAAARCLPKGAAIAAATAAAAAVAAANHKRLLTSSEVAAA